MIGPCARRVVECTITADDGKVFTGTNWCGNAQSECPRLPSEGYAKCWTVCKQANHAERDALNRAGPWAKGARAELKGHTYYCRECQEALFAAGVKTIGISADS
jgi:deoxycytidylate deaminase